MLADIDGAGSVTADRVLTDARLGGAVVPHALVADIDSRGTVTTHDVLPDAGTVGSVGDGDGCKHGDDEFHFEAP